MKLGFVAGRITLLVAALTAIGSLVWSGCGSDNGSSYCDATGCYTCDGYGCRNVSGPTIDASAGSDGATNEAAADGGGADATDSAPTCTQPTDCSSGNTCVNHQCTPCGGTNQPACACMTATDCPVSGQECWKNQCLTCGGANGPCPCAASSDCSGGNVCAGGECTPPSDVCKYTSDCAAGKICANGQCVPGCDATNGCPTGSTCTDSACVPNANGGCTSSATCPANAPYCVAGTCTAACTNGSCPTGDYCNQGACVPDTRPQTECTGNAQCNANQECIDGYCKYMCTSNMQCALIDVRIEYCASDMVCRDMAEANPQCTQQSDCAAGKNCISNTCQ